MIVRELPNIELIERIAVGGMSEVWKARQISLDRIVAVKILRHCGSASSGNVADLLTEARTAARFTHPGIVQIFDACEHNGVTYFVMEYVEGSTVLDRIHEKGHFAESDALRICVKVAHALKAAWDAFGLIHCDLKPENILIDAHGHVKVTDLGISKTDGGNTTADRDYICGTPCYMSPEQARGDPLGCPTDFYALGATLYHMLTGRTLFQGKSDEDTVQCQINAKPTPPRNINPKLSSAVSVLIHRLLRKDPIHRPKSWDAVIAQLQTVRQHHMPSDGKPLSQIVNPICSSRSKSHAQLLIIASCVTVAVLLLLLWLDSKTGDVSTPVPDPITAGVKEPMAREPARLSVIERVTPSDPMPQSGTPLPDEGVVPPSDAVARDVASDSSNKQAEQRLNDLFAKIAVHIVSDDLESAATLAESAMETAVAPVEEREIRQICGILRSAADPDLRILNSFQHDVDCSVTVATREGVIPIKVVQLERDKGTVLIMIAEQQRHLRPSDLSLAERLRRVGEEDDPAAELIRGMTAMRFGSSSRAAAHFVNLPPRLANAVRSSLSGTP